MDSSKASIEFDDDILVWEKRNREWKHYSNLKFRYEINDEEEENENCDDNESKKNEEEEKDENFAFKSNEDEDKNSKYFLQVSSTTSSNKG